MISFALTMPAKHYPPFFQAVHSLGTWCRFVDSTFLVKSQKSTSEIQDLLVPFLGVNDRLLVCEVKPPIGGWLSSEQRQWLHNNL